MGVAVESERWVRREEDAEDDRGEESRERERCR